MSHRIEAILFRRFFLVSSYCQIPIKNETVRRKITTEEATKLKKKRIFNKSLIMIFQYRSKKKCAIVIREFRFFNMFIIIFY
jgi:hypothetical protein